MFHTNLGLDSRLRRDDSITVFLFKQKPGRLIVILFCRKIIMTHTLKKILPVCVLLSISSLVFAGNCKYNDDGNGALKCTFTASELQDGSWKAITNNNIHRPNNYGFQVYYDYGHSDYTYGYGPHDLKGVIDHIVIKINTRTKCDFQQIITGNCAVNGKLKTIQFVNTKTKKTLTNSDFDSLLTKLPMGVNFSA